MISAFMSIFNFSHNQSLYLIFGSFIVGKKTGSHEDAKARRKRNEGIRRFIFTYMSFVFDLVPQSDFFLGDFTACPESNRRASRAVLSFSNPSIQLIFGAGAPR